MVKLDFLGGRYRIGQCHSLNGSNCRIVPATVTPRTLSCFGYFLIRF